MVQIGKKQLQGAIGIGNWQMQQASRTLQQVPCHSKVQFTYKNKYNELAEFIIPPSCCKISTTQKQQFSAARRNTVSLSNVLTQNYSLHQMSF